MPHRCGMVTGLVRHGDRVWCGMVAGALRHGRAGIPNGTPNGVTGGCPAIGLCRRLRLGYFCNSDRQKVGSAGPAARAHGSGDLPDQLQFFELPEIALNGVQRLLGVPGQGLLGRPAAAGVVGVVRQRQQHQLRARRPGRLLNSPSCGLPAHERATAPVNSATEFASAGKSPLGSTEP